MATEENGQNGNGGNEEENQNPPICEPAEMELAPETPTTQDCSGCPDVIELATFGMSASVGAVDAVDSAVDQFQELANQILAFAGLSIDTLDPNQLLQEAIDAGGDALQDNLPQIPSLFEIDGCPVTGCVLPIAGLTPAQIQQDLIALGKEYLNNQSQKSLGSISNTVLGQLNGLQEAMNFSINAASNPLQSAKSVTDSFKPIVDCLCDACPDQSNEIVEEFNRISGVGDAILFEGNAEMTAALDSLTEVKQCMRDQIEVNIDNLTETLTS